MSGTLANYQVLPAYEENPQLQANGTFIQPGQPGYRSLNTQFNGAPLPSSQPAAQPAVSTVMEAPESNGVTQLDAQATAQNPATITPSVLAVGPSALTFIPSVTDPNSGTILVPDGSGQLFQVPATTLGTVGQGSYAPVLPDMQMGVFSLENEAAQQQPGFDIPAGVLVGALGVMVGAATNMAGGGTPGGAAALIATNILGNLAAQGTVHIPYVAPGYNPDTAYGFFH
jgi:hypothetical protein